jgi:TRAP-type C4-dicarboxylate transport system substrate-binding protein
MYHVRRFAFSLLAVLALAAPARAATEIKIATVAPQGSAWMRIFNKMKARVKKETKGEVKLHMYAGQVQGDERDVVRKMRTGQLQGGSFTAVGLSMINPKVLVLQVPLMFKDHKQLEKVRKALHEEFEKSFRDKGYELLGWGDVGWVYLFTKNPVASKDDLKKQKVWAWGDDPLSKALMRTAGVSPRLLGLPQVYPALNTGMVNAVYNSPLACLTLQWHTKVKYYSDFPLAIAIGATVITRKAFDKLKPEHQKLLKAIAMKYHEALNKRIRKDNDKALKALRGQGIKPVTVPDASRKQFRAIAEKVAEKFAPRYYPKALLKRVRKLR